MIKELEDFWKWIGKSPQEYAEYGIDYRSYYDRVEVKFPKFEKLKNYAFEIVDKNINSKDELNDLLTIMALDNEQQGILDYIEEHSSNEQLEKLVKIGLFHLQKEARSQLCVLIFRRRPTDYKSSLLILSKDIKESVKRRAVITLHYLNKDMKSLDVKERLEQFWIWIGKSKEEYGKIGVLQNHGKEECDFPFFEDLIEYAKVIVDLRLLSSSVVDDLFVIMSIDNESENTLDYIEAHSTEAQINKLVSIGINHIQYQGRWQLSELIYRRKPDNYEKFLQQLANDSNYAVRTRACNLIEKLKEN